MLTPVELKNSRSASKYYTFEQWENMDVRSRQQAVYSPCFACADSASLSAAWSTDVLLNGSSRSVGAWNMSMITSGWDETTRNVFHCQTLKSSRKAGRHGERAVLTQCFPRVYSGWRQHSRWRGLNKTQWSVGSDMRQVTCSSLWHWDTHTVWNHPQRPVLPWQLMWYVVHLLLSLSSGSGGNTTPLNGGWEK